MLNLQIHQFMGVEEILFFFAFKNFAQLLLIDLVDDHV